MFKILILNPNAGSDKSLLTTTLCVPSSL